MEAQVTQRQLKRLQRAADITSIQMLMASYVDALSKMDVSTLFDDLFAVGNNDVSIELYESGEYCGERQVRAFLSACDDYLEDPADKNGFMELRLLCTPYIKLTKDNDRALGTWSLFCPTAKQATPYPCANRQLTAIWVCGKYYCEFVKADGAWKILKLRAIAYLRSPYEHGWVRQADCTSFPHLMGVRPDNPPRTYLYNFDYGMGNGGIEWGPYMPEDAEFE